MSCEMLNDDYNTEEVEEFILNECKNKNTIEIRQNGDSVAVVERLDYPIFADPLDGDRLGRIANREDGYNLGHEKYAGIPSHEALLWVPFYFNGTNKGSESFNLDTSMVNCDELDDAASGVVYVTEKMLKHMFGDKTPTKEEILKFLEIEAHEYQCFLQEECYSFFSFKIETDEDGNLSLVEEECLGPFCMEYSDAIDYYFKQANAEDWDTIYDITY